MRPGHSAIAILALFTGWTAMSMAGSTSDDALINGKTVYEQTCITCHGDDGTGGMPGVPDMTESGGSLEKPDEVLKHNIISGMQSPGVAIAMPAWGGNPALTENQIDAVITYMRDTFSIEEQVVHPGAAR